ncbi:unnamed protein product [Prorocentrum cordatum]|uniref:Uncharacterized protein n=1 Tax=Prorocentrum cordatum TaxID=2364126 RepID=A0ABN9YDH8_9DINO|nr:unnamed protein product [Polarella glacialis]
MQTVVYESMRVPLGVWKAAISNLATTTGARRLLPQIASKTVVVHGAGDTLMNEQNQLDLLRLLPAGTLYREIQHSGGPPRRQLPPGRAALASHNGGLLGPLRWQLDHRAVIECVVAAACPLGAAAHDTQHHAATDGGPIPRDRFTAAPKTATVAQLPARGEPPSSSAARHRAGRRSRSRSSMLSRVRRAGLRRGA